MDDVDLSRRPAVPVDFSAERSAWRSDRPAPRRVGRVALRGALRGALHLSLLAATVVTTTVMGTLLSVDVPSSNGLVPAASAYLGAILADPIYLACGLTFSFVLLTILGAHELGHYVACRYYGVDASLPYFLPAPPPILIGTFGAFIRIRSPITSRRALFDIGVAGPLAGFCFALPAAAVGLAFASPAPHDTSVGAIVLHDPLLLVLFERLFGLPQSIAWNPIYFGAWVGLFATGLNLIPIGQLDGGHATYALFGERGHRVASRVLFVAVALLALVAFARFDSPVWFLYVVILALLAFRRHPPPLVFEEEIGPGRRVVAALVALVFVLSFLPVPITVS